MTTMQQDEWPPTRPLDPIELQIWTVGVLSNPRFADAIDDVLQDRSHAEAAEVEASETFTRHGFSLLDGMSVSVRGSATTFSEAATTAAGEHAEEELETQFCAGGVCLTVQVPWEIFTFSAVDSSTRPAVARDRLRRRQLALVALLADVSLREAIEAVVADLPDSSPVDIAPALGARGVRLPAGTGVVAHGHDSPTFTAADRALAGDGPVGAESGGGASVCWFANSTVCITFRPVFVLSY